MIFNLIRVACRIGLLLLLTLPFPTKAIPKRDHLTSKEADMVREAQALDLRIGVFIKAADRRVLAAINPNGVNQSQKDIEPLDELKGTRADFLYDLSKILDEAITNIDDVSGRDERNPLVPKAVRKLAEASSRFLVQLSPMRDKLSEGPERQSYDRAVEYAQSIVEAASKLPPPEKTTKKKETD